MTHKYHLSVSTVHDRKQQNPHFNITIAEITDIHSGKHSADIHVALIVGYLCKSQTGVCSLLFPVMDSNY
jgi:hypothetical protein